MRITGGMYCSRALRVPAGRTTRPTSDRVREALFGILSSAGVIQGARVLDVYAGTGALSLEALSRGAARATLVESSREAIAAVRANIDALGVAGVTRLLAADAHRSVRRIAREGPFDLVLADPPWALVEAGDAPRALIELARADVLADGAWVVLEHSSRTPSPPLAPLVWVESREYGDTALSFYKMGILAVPRQDVIAGFPSD